MDASILAAGAVAIAAQIYVSPIPEVSTIKVLATYSIVNIALSLYLFSYMPILASITRIWILNTTFLVTVFSLTLIRRAFFSPLSAFPGPRRYGLSILFKVNLYRADKGGYALLDLLNKYNSDIIRTGPNELCVRDVEVVERLYKGKYPRGPIYDVAKVGGAVDLNSVRDYKVHTPWRRVW